MNTITWGLGLGHVKLGGHSPADNSPLTPEVRRLWAEAYPLTHPVPCHLTWAWDSLTNASNSPAVGSEHRPQRAVPFYFALGGLPSSKPSQMQGKVSFSEVIHADPLSFADLGQTWPKL